MKYDAELELDDDPEWGSGFPRIEKIEYHCPEYVQGQSVRFQLLPTEILLGVITSLDPRLDMRTLRCVRTVFKGTNIEFLGDVAEQVLERQRTRLLGTKGWLCTCSVDGHSRELDKFVGKQYVCEKEDIEGDEWAFKKSQLPLAKEYVFSSLEFSDDMFYQDDRLNINVGTERNIAEDEIASRLNGVSPNQKSWKGTLRKPSTGLKGYGGVCQWIHWG